jgi:hypothetical protein
MFFALSVLKMIMLVFYELYVTVMTGNSTKQRDEVGTGKQRDITIGGGWWVSSWCTWEVSPVWSRAFQGKKRSDNTSQVDREDRFPSFHGFAAEAA